MPHPINRSPSRDAGEVPDLKVSQYPYTPRAYLDTRIESLFFVTRIYHILNGHYLDS